MTTLKQDLARQGLVAIEKKQDSLDAAYRDIQDIMRFVHENTGEELSKEHVNTLEGIVDELTIAMNGLHQSYTQDMEGDHDDK